MARFDLTQYATVAERLAQFHTDYPDGRITTTLVESKDMGNGKTQWVVKADVFLTAGDQANFLPKGTGFAAEVDGTGGANNVAALPNAERCETSSIGRALANYIYSGSKRPSREEMEKVARMDWLERAGSLGTIEELRDLYAQAKANNASQEVLEGLKLYAQRFEESQATRAGGGVSGGKVSRTGK
jgi:hypothetical protein